MTTTSTPSAFRRLLRVAPLPPAKVRALVLAMTITAAMVTSLAVVRIKSQHEVIDIGYQLSRSASQLRAAREMNRRLELERATLTAPARIEALATQLGMVPAAPDQVRVVSSAMAVVR